MLKPLSFLFALSLTAFAEPVPKKNVPAVILDETAVKNLGIETAEAETTDFEQTVFALGRIRIAPGRRAVVSSRVPGRIVSVSAQLDRPIEKQAEVAVLESRQPGDPPPAIRLSAPIGGLVSAAKVVVGQAVTPDDTLFEIIDLSAVQAVAAVPEHLAGRLQSAQTAHIRVAALPGRTFEARLAHLAATADARSGTLEAIFELPNPEQLLRPDMRAEFSIVLSKREGVTSVPREALQGDATDRFLYVADYDLKNAFVKVPVVIGAMNDRFVEITSGLLPGDEVVTRGAYSLAFAGQGSVSLKQALDAAHGHEHNEDGSEKGSGPAHAEHGDEDHDDHGPQPAGLSRLTLLSLAANGLLLVGLAFTLRRKASTGAR